MSEQTAPAKAKAKKSGAKKAAKVAAAHAEAKTFKQAEEILTEAPPTAGGPSSPPFFDPAAFSAE